ncbi:DUF3883 domain-containing protein, partial [Gemmatimonadota bacterium]
RDWTRVEVEATVADYLEMLWLELHGEPHVKVEHRRRLQRLLDDRSEAAIERKHQKISAILIELGLPYVSGYKPLSNYQALLFDVVEDRVASSESLTQLVSRQVDEPAVPPALTDWEEVLVAPSTGRRGAEGAQSWQRRTARKIDYLAREARYASLGQAGEVFVLEFERARLKGQGEERLAQRIEHISETRGDGEGFDILSFEPGGREKIIEVKTTAFAKETPFCVTRNELRISEEYTDEYSLYRVFDFGRAPRLFTLSGELRSMCVLDPTQFIARAA